MDSGEPSSGRASNSKVYLGATYLLQICGFIAAFSISFTAALACWFAGAVAGGMGLAKRCFPGECAFGMCINALFFLYGLFALHSLPH